MMTECKADFIPFFEEKILEPRYLNYKIMFPGPTGTNAIEAALKVFTTNSCLGVDGSLSWDDIGFIGFNE